MEKTHKRFHSFAPGRACFTGATFGDSARFVGAAFSDYASFAYAAFGDSATFQSATFGELASFVCAAFGELASFDHAAFDGEGIFLGAAFGEWAGFCSVTFDNGAVFDGVAFGDFAEFDNTVFKGPVEFTGWSLEEWKRDLARTDGIGEEARIALEKRHEESWRDNWARLDTNYSPAPYAQLAAALTSAGDRDAANEIRYLGRERERQAAWNQHNWGTWLWWSVLWYGIGYGIGLRPFLVLIWVLVFSAIGAAILWHTVPTTRSLDRGKLWCFGASLARLLPVIEISKEFKDFFDNPERLGLTRLQRRVFAGLAAGLAILGWALGAILLAAVSGLTQSS